MSLTKRESEAKVALICILAVLIGLALMVYGFSVLPLVPFMELEVIPMSLWLGSAFFVGGIVTFFSTHFNFLKRLKPTLSWMPIYFVLSLIGFLGFTFVVPGFLLLHLADLGPWGLLAFTLPAVISIIVARFCSTAWLRRVLGDLENELSLPAKIIISKLPAVIIYFILLTIMFNVVPLDPFQSYLVLHGGIDGIMLFLVNYYVRVIQSLKRHGASYTEANSWTLDSYLILIAAVLGLTMLSVCQIPAWNSAVLAWLSSVPVLASAYSVVFPFLGSVLLLAAVFNFVNVGGVSHSHKTHLALALSVGLLGTALAAFIPQLLSMNVLVNLIPAGASMLGMGVTYLLLQNKAVESKSKRSLIYAVSSVFTYVAASLLAAFLLPGGLPQIGWVVELGLGVTSSYIFSRASFKDIASMVARIAGDLKTAVQEQRGSAVGSSTQHGQELEHDEEQVEEDSHSKQKDDDDYMPEFNKLEQALDKEHRSGKQAEAFSPPASLSTAAVPAHTQQSSSRAPARATSLRI